MEAKNMNLTKLKEQLLETGKSIGLQVQEENAQSISLHAQIVAKDYFENSIYCNLTIFESGTFHMFLTFDEIEKTYDNLFLINHFNAEHPWFKAYISNINDKDFLELHYATLKLNDEKEVIDAVGYLMNNILKEETLNILKPIIASSKEIN